VDGDEALSSPLLPAEDGEEVVDMAMSARSTFCLRHEHQISDGRLLWSLLLSDKAVVRICFGS
jgi:hypothetical protein